MRWIRPYCQSSTVAKAQAPVKIIQRRSGAPSAIAFSRAGDMAIALMPYSSDRSGILRALNMNLTRSVSARHLGTRSVAPRRKGIGAPSVNGAYPRDVEQETAA